MVVSPCYNVLVFYVKLSLMFLWIALCFAVASPLSLIFFRHPDFLSCFLRSLSRGILLIGGLRVVLENENNLYQEQPCIYVANHQSAMDIITFGSITPRRTTFLAKREILLLPLVGLVFWAGGAFFIDRRNRALAIKELDRVAKNISKRQLNICIAPEGTRNAEGSSPFLPFKKGPFHYFN